MPNFRTHSIHGELVLPQIDSKVELDREDIKSFCIGPDAMISTDYKTFDYQHAHKTRRYFCTLLNLIKKNKLQDNSETMAFLYGQIDHFILDSVMHPLIYYMTEDIKSKHLLSSHTLVENWIDDYTSQKTGKTDKLYYHKLFIQSKELMKLIDETYKKVYGSLNEGSKYSFGMFATIVFDILAKRNYMLIAPLVIKLANLGDFTYRKDYKRVLPFLNLNREKWYNPETDEESKESFDDLWEKSIDISLETIEDVNNYLYKGKELNNRLISNDISYNTGLSCSKGQKLKFLKRYKKNRI